MPSRPMHVVTDGKISFFFLKPGNIPLYVYSTFSLFIHMLMDIWVVSASWLLWIILLWALVFARVPPFTSYGRIPKNCIARAYENLHFVFLRNSKLFSTASVHFFIPTNRVLDSPYLWEDLLFFTFLIIVTLMGVRFFVRFFNLVLWFSCWT